MPGIPAALTLNAAEDITPASAECGEARGNFRACRPLFHLCLTGGGGIVYNATVMKKSRILLLPTALLLAAVMTSCHEWRPRRDHQPPRPAQ